MNETVQAPHIPRRELQSLLAYAESRSHKEAAHRLGISESTSRQRVSNLCHRIGVSNATQAVWRLHLDLEGEKALRDGPPPLT